MTTISTSCILCFYGLFRVHVFQRIKNAVSKRWWFERNLISILLILGLVVSIPLILLFLEYNLGINIVTEIIGIVVTIFVIEKLLHWNEKRLWKKVKNQVFDRLGEEIYYIIIDLKNFIDLPSQIVGGGVGLEENLEEFKKKKFFESLDFLCNAESISMNKIFRKMIKTGGFGEIYSLREKYLSDIETKYFRFLTPDILIPLMNLQRRLHSLDLRIRNRQNRLQRGWAPLLKENEFNEMISIIVKLIFTEICKLKEANLKLYID